MKHARNLNFELTDPLFFLLTRCVPESGDGEELLDHGVHVADAS